MKRLLYIVLAALGLSLMWACNSYKVIPDRELAQIFHDAMLVNAYISNDANFVAEINSLDLMVYASGQSRIHLNGCTHYQTAEISTAEYDARGLETISTRVESSHNATVKVDAVERLEAKTTTGGKVYYLSHPVILRSEITLFGGEIQRL